MLTVADEHLHELNPDVSTALFGQEINPRTYAICKADLLIRGGQDAPTSARATRSWWTGSRTGASTMCCPTRRSAVTGRPLRPR